MHRFLAIYGVLVSGFLILALSSSLWARDFLPWLPVNETTFEFAEPECFKYGPYDAKKQMSACEIQGRVRVYLKSYPSTPPVSSKEREAIECREPKREGRLLNQESIQALMGVSPSLQHRCFWVPVVEASFFNSRRLLKVLKAGQIHSPEKLAPLACPQIWTACKFLEKL